MLSVQPIHPFPARMAPELALREIQKLPKRATVLDPMMGSGTVVRVAIDCGHRTIGRDVDPLSVLMTRVWTTPIDTKLFRECAVHVLNTAKNMGTQHISLPWIDDDPETSAYIDFWFGDQQKVDLRKLSSLIVEISGTEGEALRIALSRIIVTKKVGASLAHDVSHSRPHRVLQENSFAVLEGFWHSVSQVAKRLETYPIQEQADVRQEDTRNLTSIANHSVDAVITSPPYLNAIDYLRGHRLALVWLGYRVSEIRPIRSGSIGAERGPEEQADTRIAEEIIDQMSLRDFLPGREQRLITRYILDLFAMLLEIHRVLRPGGRVVFVIGNSCLHGVFIRNALAVILLAERIGFECIREEERELPPNRRYLPPPSVLERTNLKKRMRTETVLTFVRLCGKLSQLARRGIMAYAERAILTRKSQAPWRLGHGSPMPYELLTGSGSMELLQRGMDLMEELMLQHRKVIFVPSAPSDRHWLTLGQALNPLEFVILETIEERMLRIVNQGHFRSYEGGVRNFCKKVGPQFVLGIYRTASAAPPYLFFSHVDHACEAALIAMADSVLQEHRGFPMLIDLADMICSTTFGNDIFNHAVQMAYSHAGEPFRFLNERQTRARG